MSSELHLPSPQTLLCRKSECTGDLAWRGHAKLLHLTWATFILCLMSPATDSCQKLCHWGGGGGGVGGGGWEGGEGQFAHLWSTCLVLGSMHLVKGTDGLGGPGLWYLLHGLGQVTAALGLSFFIREVGLLAYCCLGFGGDDT